MSTPEELPARLRKAAACLEEYSATTHDNGLYSSAANEIDRLRTELEASRLECERLMAALYWIATVNAMDYEYVAVARAAMKKERTCPT